MRIVKTHWWTDCVDCGTRIDFHSLRGDAACPKCRAPTKLVEALPVLLKFCERTVGKRALDKTVHGVSCVAQVDVLGCWACGKEGLSLAGGVLTCTCGATAKVQPAPPFQGIIEAPARAERTVQALSCPQCGASLPPADARSVARCEFCSTLSVVRNAADDVPWLRLIF